MKLIRTSRSSGFTLIEVMIALGLLAVGSLGVMSMQHAAVYANRVSRSKASAQYIADTMMGRVDRAALGWTNPGINDLTLINADFLSEIVNQVTTTGWFRPVSSIADEQNAFDYTGRDTANTGNNALANLARYCTHMRLTWFERYQSVRVEVRVFWLRQDPSTSDDAVAGTYIADTDCADGNETALQDDVDANTIPNIRSYAISKVVRYTPQ